VKRDKRLLLPTPESPMSTTTKTTSEKLTKFTNHLANWQTPRGGYHIQTSSRASMGQFLQRKHLSEERFAYFSQKDLLKIK
jgi:hypothetical protein